mgnify:CR=1 FL=1
MKNRSKFIKFFCFSICLFFSCGLDTFYVIPSPLECNFTPIVSDLSSYNPSFGIEIRYFDFYTNEESYDEIESFNFLGTSIYYKIYNSLSQLNNDRYELERLANSDETSVYAPSKLIETYKFCLLNNREPLIPYKGKNQNVYIRLSSYENNLRYSSRILIDKDFEEATQNDTYLIPLRIDGKFTFNFGRAGENDNVPQSDDIDVKYSPTSTQEGVWYVSMFAVAVGMDETFTKTYSNILWLGSVAIDANSYDN